MNDTDDYIRHDLEHLASKRLDRVKGALSATVIDLLRAAAHDIETGVLKADAAIIVMVDRKNPDRVEHHTYRAGVTREQEVVYLDLAHDRAKRAYRGE